MGASLPGFDSCDAQSTEVHRAGQTLPATLLRPEVVLRFSSARHRWTNHLANAVAGTGVFLALLRRAGRLYNPSVLLM